MIVADTNKLKDKGKKVPSVDVSANIIAKHLAGLGVPDNKELVKAIKDNEGLNIDKLIEAVDNQTKALKQNMTKEWEVFVERDFDNNISKLTFKIL